VRGGTRKRGSTWTAYWWTKDADGAWRQHSKGGFTRERDAQSHLNKLLPKLDEGSWRPDSPMTVKQLLTDHYLPARRSEGLRATTLAQYRAVADHWIVPHVGAAEVRHLTPAKVQEWVAHLQSSGGRGGKPLGPRSVQLAVTVLKAATTWAVVNGHLNRDPLAGFKRPRGGASLAKSAWTTEEATTFLRSVRGDRFEAAWWLLTSLGMRRGEVAGLRWSALDLGAGVLRVVETLVVVDGHARTSEPKTESGRRAIELPAPRLLPAPSPGSPRCQGETARSSVEHLLAWRPRPACRAA